MPAETPLAHYQTRYQEIERQRGGGFGGQSKLWRLSRFYQRGIKRLNHEEPDSFDEVPTGERFLDPSHVYAHDLGVLGEKSLFERLCIARSGIGQRGLANYLLSGADREEILARQEAVRELRDEHELREKMVLLGPHMFSEARWETFTEWLDAPRVVLPGPALHALLVVTTIILAIFIGVSVTQRDVSPIAVAMALVQGAIGLLLRERVQAAIGGLGALSVEVGMLREGLALLEGRTFQSSKLRGLVEQVQGSAGSLRGVERLLWVCKEREKDWFFALSHGVMAGVHISMAIERWRAKHGADLRRWLPVWGEFEALNALGCYAFESPGSVFPKIVEEGACYEAVALGHPLLPDNNCVRNDVALNAGQRFYVISGSNMAGKSTLLRAIGMNALLAMAGAPVRATSLRMTPLSIVASLSIADSLANGVSKFRAEVERIKQAIDLTAAERQVLFLIDEIFSGTNSRDRRAAAEAVVRTLIGKGAIGALSTHDLALTEIADDPELHGTNVHMGSRGEGDPMDFDYLLKPGVTQESNAIAIARMAGVVTWQSTQPTSRRGG